MEKLQEVTRHRYAVDTWGPEGSYDIYEVHVNQYGATILNGDEVVVSGLPSFESAQDCCNLLNDGISKEDALKATLVAVKLKPTKKSPAL